MWGQVNVEAKKMSESGIIPTRVGTSTKAFFNQFGQEDHPHACGDKCINASSVLSLGGSSPRVWGQEFRQIQMLPSERIIPTRVGTRAIFLLKSLSGRDHPHACGDKQYIDWIKSSTGGSSPRVWGQV